MSNDKNPKPVRTWDSDTDGGVAPYWTVSASTFMEDQDLSMLLKGKMSKRWSTNHLIFAMVGHPLLRFVGLFLPHAENLEIRFRRLERPSCAKGLY